MEANDFYLFLCCSFSLFLPHMNIEIIYLVLLITMMSVVVHRLNLRVEVMWLQLLSVVLTWSWNLTRWSWLTGKEENCSTPSPFYPAPPLSLLLPSITITIARPPPTPSARAGARVAAAAAPNLSQSRRSPVDAARLDRTWRRPRRRK